MNANRLCPGYNRGPCSVLVTSATRFHQFQVSENPFLLLQFCAPLRSYRYGFEDSGLLAFTLPFLRAGLYSRNCFNVPAGGLDRFVGPEVEVVVRVSTDPPSLRWRNETASGDHPIKSPKETPRENRMICSKRLDNHRARSRRRRYCEAESHVNMALSLVVPLPSDSIRLLSSPHPRTQITQPGTHQTDPPSSPYSSRRRGRGLQPSLWIDRAPPDLCHDVNNPGYPSPVAPRNDNSLILPFDRSPSESAPSLFNISLTRALLIRNVLHNVGTGTLRRLCKGVAHEVWLRRLFCGCISAEWKGFEETRPLIMDLVRAGCGWCPLTSPSHRLRTIHKAGDLP